MDTWGCTWSYGQRINEGKAISRSYGLDIWILGIVSSSDHSCLILSTPVPSILFQSQIIGGIKIEYLLLSCLFLQVRDPMPAVFFFLVDVSMNAIQTGATAAACSAINQVIADLPVRLVLKYNFFCLILNKCHA